MNQVNYMKLLSLLAFVAFAAVSCWATAESLHLLLPSWPVVLCWIVTIGFFVIASLGSKMIVDSMNPNIYQERRGLTLMGGLFLLLVFWLVCSMPTNTHTFFYRNSIGDIAAQDIFTTKTYLQMLRDNVKTEAQIKARQDELRKELDNQETAFMHEIDNMANRGFGDKAKAILLEISKTLQVKPIQELSHKDNSEATLRMLKQQYHAMFMDMLAKRNAQIAAAIRNTQEKTYKPLATKSTEELTAVENELKEMNLKGDVDNELVSRADVALKRGYGIVKNYHQYVRFNSEEDKALYLADNQVTRTSRMLSVIDVWKDFLAGKHAGRGFIFWVVISVLVDIAAFIFFDLAFRKEE